MKLPNHLASRYSRITSEEMSGSKQASALIKSSNLKSRGNNPGLIQTEHKNSPFLRPGVISFDDHKGVSFNMRKAGGKSTGATHKNLDKLLSSRYIQQTVHQGQEVEEFTPRATPMSSPQAKLEVAKAAAEVEVKAKALAVKAKSAKEAALSGLGYFADAASDLAAAQTEFAAANTEAFSPTCPPNNLPAFTCDPAKMARFVNAQEGLAKAAKAVGDTAAAKTAAEGAAKIEAAQSKGGGMKTLIIGLVVIAIAVGAYLHFTKGVEITA
jgi:hypothetical protein